MAEISGLTVGVVSLGIQVCKGLISYYTQFRNAGEDIKDVVISIEGLQATLKTLELVKTRTVDPNNAITKQAEKAMKDCNDGLNRLDTMRRKCLDIKLAGNLQDKIKHAKNRLFWPFRKDTLNDMQNVVDRLQENLQLAVQLLGIDIEDQHHRELSNLIVTKSDGIDDHLGNQDAAIQGIHTDISNLSISQKQQSASAALQYQSQTSMLSSHTASLQAIQGGVSGLSASLQGHEASMNLQLATQNSLLVSQTANLKDTIDFLIKSNQTQQSLLVRQLDAGLDTLRQDIRDQLRGPPQIQPISQEEILNSFSNQCSPFQRRLRTYNNAITGLPKTDGTTCTCLIRGQRTWSRKRGWIFSTISRSFHSHAPECLQFSHSDFSVEIEKEFKVLSWWCLSIGFSKSREVGKMRMYPSISFRSMVSRDSPSFQPFIEAENWIYDEFWGYRSKSEMIDLFSNLVKSVRQSIEEGKARPTDTLPDGSTLMHSAIELTFPLRSHLHHDQDVFDDFLTSLIGLGVPTNEADDDGRTPATKLLTDRNNLNLWSFFLGKVDNWRVPLQWHEWGILPSESQDMALILTLESVNATYEPHFPFEEAILRRSEPNLRALLRTTDTKWNHAGSDSGGHTLETLLYLAMGWYEGAALILEASRLHSESPLRWRDSEMLVRLIRYCYNTKLFHLLLQEGYPTTSRHWEVACASSSTVQIKDIIRALADDFGKKSKVLNVKGLLLNEIDGGELQGLYHTDSLCRFAATCLWDAGFRNVDSEGYAPDVLIRKIGHCYGTPLWLVSSRYISNENLKLLKWLVSKKARLDWAHPLLKTTPRIQMCCSLFLDSFYLAHRPKHSAFISSLLWSSSRDECQCLCSEHGCVPFIRISGHPTRQFLPAISKLQGANPLLGIIVEAVLRRVTFDELRMTHTCCSRSYGGDHEALCSCQQAKQGIHTIPCVQSQNAELLELLTIELKEKSENYEGSLVQFLDEVWQPRMKDVAIQRDKQYYIEKIRELGVRIEGSEGTCSEDEDIEGSEEVCSEDEDSEDSEEQCSKDKDVDSSPASMLRCGRHTWLVSSNGSLEQVVKSCSCQLCKDMTTDDYFGEDSDEEVSDEEDDDNENHGEADSGEEKSGL